MNNRLDSQYKQLVEDIISIGVTRTDRTGVGTKSLFGRTIKLNLQEGFPLLTAKRTFFKGALGEMLWFLGGVCNNKDLNDMGINIWNEWADPETGELGGIYGVQWRGWKKFPKLPWPGGHQYDHNIERVDQIAELIKNLKENPHSRRLIVEGWNVGELDQMALPPCHKSFQLYCDTENNRLSLMLYQRSSDVGLGLPFNIAQYASLLHMFAHLTGYTPWELTIVLGDVHIYLNHLGEDQLPLVLERAPKKLPTLHINRRVDDIDDFKYEDFTLEGYDPHPSIKLPVAV